MVIVELIEIGLEILITVKMGNMVGKITEKYLYVRQEVPNVFKLGGML